MFSGDAVVTHGHVHAICGAIFHALCLESVMKAGNLPNPGDWALYIDRFRDLPKLIAEGPRAVDVLAAGLGSRHGHNDCGSDWTIERRSSTRLPTRVDRLLDTADLDSYSRALKQIGCLGSEFRGSGIKTALAAAALAQCYGDFKIEQC